MYTEYTSNILDRGIPLNSILIQKEPILKILILSEQTENLSFIKDTIRIINPNAELHESTTITAQSLQRLITHIGIPHLFIISGSNGPFVLEQLMLLRKISVTRLCSFAVFCDDDSPDFLEQLLRAGVLSLQSLNRISIELLSGLLKKIEIRVKIQLDAAKAATNRRQALSTASHDLRSPLCIISSYSKLLLEKKANTLDPETQDLLSRIEENSELALRVINSTLNQVKDEKAEIRLSAIVDLTSIVELAIRNSQKQFELKSQKIIFNTGESALICGDQEQLSLLVKNLIENAIKYSDMGKSIFIKIEKFPTPHPNGEKFLLTVRDQGVGIPKEELRFIFDRYYQSKNVKPDNSGFGIGLATCKEIVDNHSAKIWATSTEGRGSMFMVLFEQRLERVNISKALRDLKVVFVSNKECTPIDSARYLQLFNIHATVFNSLNDQAKEHICNERPDMILSCSGFFDQVQEYLNSLDKNFQIPLYRTVIRKSSLGTNEEPTDFLQTQFSIKEFFKVCDQAIVQFLKKKPTPALVSKDIVKPLINIKIAFVDDSIDNHRILHYLLEDSGAQLICFEDPINAIESLVRSPPDVLITDFLMPEISGPDFLRRFREISQKIYGSISKIVATADMTEATESAMKDLEIDQILRKPFNKNDLLNAIQRARKFATFQ
jgi:signal transduction histidine kinase/CheY-like chemotaxis protein